MSKILVVDDERHIRDALVSLFQGEGHVTDIAGDGFEALERVRENKYDLVLTDLHMPRMNGLELVRILREQERDQVPVIIITAFATQDSSKDFLKSGVEDLIIKPFDIQRILGAINKVFSRSIPAATAVAAGLMDVESTQLENNPAAPGSEDAGIETDSTDSSPTTKIISALFNMIQSHFQTDFSHLRVTQHGEIKSLLKRSTPASEPGQREWEEQVLDEVMRTGEPILIPNLAQDPRAQKRWGVKEGALLAVPLSHNQSILGGITLYQRHDNATYNEETLKFLSTLASLIALTLSKDEEADELANAQTDTVQSLLAVIETMDPYISNHSARVACYTLLLAKKMSLNEAELRKLEYLALLHDIGKIVIPERIIHKHSDFTEAEYDMLKTHSTVGETIIQPLRFIEDGGKIIRHHHENFDGTGFPDKLQGEAIPLYSRIIAVANVFDHLMSQNSPQDKEGRAKTIDKMIKLEDRELDGDLLKQFLNAYFKIVMLNP